MCTLCIFSQVLSQFCWPHPPSSRPPRPATLLILESSCHCGMNLQRRGHMWLKKAHQKHTQMERLSIKCAQRFVSPWEICDLAAFRCSYFRYCLESFYSEVTGGNLSPLLYTCQTADLVTLTQTFQYFTPHYSCQVCIKHVFAQSNQLFAELI